MDERIRVKVILGSVRQGRFGERPAKWLLEQASKLDGVDVELLDLRDYPMPFFDSAISPSMMNRKYQDPTVQKWADKLDEADAFIIVSPEYNHSYSGVLKNALDWTSPEWRRKPVGFVSYGSASGARAIEHLRMVVIELRAVPINRSIHINWDFIVKTFGDKGIDSNKLFAPLRDGSLGIDHVAVFLDELVWMAKALKGARSGKA